MRHDGRKRRSAADHGRTRLHAQRGGSALIRGSHDRAVHGLGRNASPSLDGRPRSRLGHGGVRNVPGSTSPRKRRDVGKVDGRTTEIQRLIGRSLRAVVDLAALGEHRFSSIATSCKPTAVRVPPASLAP